jgi:anti-sigma-K factor RskA
MTEEDDIDALAAEYVLGSLSREERTGVDARRGSDRALDAAVAAWERRLAPLSDFIPGERPPAHVFEGIAMRIWGQPHATRPANVLLLQHTTRRWRKVAIAAGALAAILAIVVVLLLQNLPTPPTALVAVLHKSSAGHTADENADAKGQPAFVVTIDMQAKTIQVTPVAARPVPRRSYELWLLQQQTPPLPLGVIAPSGPTAVAWPSAAQRAEQFQPRALRNATLAISLEPEGGPASSAPTGPLLFEGRLLPIGAP